MADSSDLTELVTKPAAALGLVTAGIALAFGVCFSIQIIPFVLALACFVLLIALSRLRTANLLVAYILADHLCQFLKRAIFLLGSQPVEVYYGFQLLPTLVLVMAVASSLYSVRKDKFPLSAKLLAVYLAIAAAETFFSPSDTSLFNRFAGINQQLVPMCAAFAGMTLLPHEWKRVAKLLLVLIVISSVFGMYQLVHGPTVIDRAWALQTGDYSIEGSKVLSFITGASSEFRAYSYYADPTTWGFFLVMALLFLVFVGQTKPLPKFWLRLAIGFSLIGMVATETRSPWVAILGALLIHRVLQVKAMRRPMVVITGILVAFGLVLSVGQYAFQHWVPKLTNNALLNRYMTVGTIEARTSAPELFLEILPKHIFVGDGFGSAGNGIKVSAEQYSHNVLVGLLLDLGLPGLLAFGVIFYAWTWESLKVAHLRRPEWALPQRWIIAACVGMAFTGALNGPLFLSSYFAIFQGIAMGQVMRWRQKVEMDRIALNHGLSQVHAAVMAAREVSV